MATYSYEATDRSGKLKKGTMVAKDKNALVGTLQQMGYFPVKIQDPEESNASIIPNLFIFKKVSSKQLTAFTHQLSSMLEAGLTLDKSLAILVDLEEDRVLKGIIQGVSKSIQSGSTLADSLSKYPEVFPNVYVSMVKAGEVSGTLEVVLGRLGRLLEEAERVKDEIRSALIYPILLTLVGGAAVSILLIFVIPRFSVIFSDMGGTLPVPTKILLNISGFIARCWWVILGSAIAVLLGLRYYTRTEGGRLLLDGTKLKLPLFGKLHQKSVVSRFSRVLGTLLQSGVSIVESLKIADESMGNKAMSIEMAAVVDGVRRGRGIAAPLRECGKFPLLALHMLTVGEETGRLDEMLIHLASTYDHEIAVSTKRLISLMEPILILIMGLIVGFIVLSMLLAVFSLNEIPI